MQVDDLTVMTYICHILHYLLLFLHLLSHCTLVPPFITPNLLQHLRSCRKILFLLLRLLQNSLRTMVKSAETTQLQLGYYFTFFSLMRLSSSLLSHLSLLIYLFLQLVLTLSDQFVASIFGRIKFRTMLVSLLEIAQLVCDLRLIHRRSIHPTRLSCGHLLEVKRFGSDAQLGNRATETNTFLHALLENITAAAKSA